VNRAQNEKAYVRIIGEALGKNGVPNHAVVDTSRNAVSGWRWEWEDWCNVYGGLGGGSGVSDGNAEGEGRRRIVRGGGWMQGYFEMLVENAKPAVEV